MVTETNELRYGDHQLEVSAFDPQFVLAAEGDPDHGSHTAEMEARLVVEVQIHSGRVEEHSQEVVVHSCPVVHREVPVLEVAHEHHRALVRRGCPGHWEVGRELLDHRQLMQVQRHLGRRQDGTSTAD